MRNKALVVTNVVRSVSRTIKGGRDDCRHDNNSNPFALSGLYNGFNHGNVEEGMSNLKSMRKLITEFRTFAESPDSYPESSGLKAAASQLEQLCDEWEEVLGHDGETKPENLLRAERYVIEAVLGTEEDK
jgi:hypothetical protein